MSNKQWESMDEKTFEKVLESSVPEIPPEDIVAEVTPWKKAMNQTLAGMILCTMTLDFWNLNYILPGIGMVLLLLGFRSLRLENRWFGSCFAITVIRGAYLFFVLIINTTIFASTFFTSSTGTVLTAVNLFLMIFQFFCLWQGFRAVQRKVGLPPRAAGAAALIIWSVIMCILAVLRYSGLVIVAALIIWYVFIIRSLCKLSAELDEAGYAIRAVPVRVTDKTMVVAIVSALVIGGAFGYIFGGSYPMDWSEEKSSENTETEAIRDRLTELGFPEYAMEDLTPEDLAACEGALQIVVEANEQTVKDVKELRITGIGVQVPGEEERWVLFHHFLWTEDPGFYGTESIQLWTTYRDIKEGWASDGEVTGRVLYDREGKTFAAPYYFLGSQTFTSDTIFWGEQRNTDVFAAFSMPRRGENYRGYVTYPVVKTDDGYIISSWMNYTHQRSRFQYPVMTAMEKRMTYGWNDAGAFITVQDALQFLPEAVK